MRLLCMLRYCRFGPWRSLETTRIEPDGEWVRRSSFQRRECLHCGRRQERSLTSEWDGYHIDADEQITDTPKPKARRDR